MSDAFRSAIRAPKFPPKAEWLNVEQPLSMLSLRAKAVLLDFCSSRRF